MVMFTNLVVSVVDHLDEVIMIVVSVRLVGIV